MEAASVEDQGRDFSFNVFCYNVRSDGAKINYKTGTVDITTVQGETKKPTDKRTYVLNTNSMKFHYPSCEWAQKISDANKIVYHSRDDAVADGKVPCTACNP